MGRLRLAAKYGYYRTVRALARFVPPGLLYYLLMPYAAMRSVRPALKYRHLPARQLPVDPNTPLPGFLTRLRYQMSFHQRWLALLWFDLWDKPPWRDRLKEDESDTMKVVQGLLRDRPTIAMTLHTGGMIALGVWLARYAKGVGSVSIWLETWNRPESAQMRADPRWRANPDSGMFLAGDTRAMVRYMAPGRSMALQADHQLGRTVTGTWSGGTLTLSAGGFRIAKMTGATVIPILITDDGHWRYEVHVGEPVPQDLIDTGDEVGAATHVARELMPMAAARPNEAMGTLVQAVKPAS